MTAPYTLLKGWELKARKELGQNFLKDTHAAGQIAALAQIRQDEMVLEIGAGLGTLTIAAARLAKGVVAVEKDSRLIPLLRSELLLHGLTNVRIVEEDILRLDFSGLVEAGARPVVVLGNLPYNISSQVVVRLIRYRHLVGRAVLMFQKELAERLCAGPGSKTYGRLSVLLQYCADLKPIKYVRADQFFPKPKVDSAVLRIDFKTAISHAVRDEGLFSRVVQAGFGQRRKTMRNALAGNLLLLDAQAAARLLEEVDIDPRRRAETLSVNDFVTLTNHIGAHLLPKT
jgi:16S rRNA (adenine1518-N6/adenine1519-N6)-dimethyltransferase